MRNGSRLGRMPERALRLAMTAVGFAFAGVSSLLLALVVFPVIRILPNGDRGEESTDGRVQLVLSRAFRFYFSLLTRLGVLRLEGQNIEALARPGTLVVANHPTLIDALALMSFMPQADCVVKDWYYDNFWLSGTAKAAGYIPNRNGPDLVEACAERLRRNRSVLIFPEGTRSPKGGLGAFARGAAHIALRSGCDPVPVTIRCDPATLYRGQAWWDIPERRFTISLEVGRPILISQIVEQSPSRARAARTITQALTDHFERQLEIDRSRRAA